MPRPLRICLVTQEFPPYTNWGGVGVQFDNFAQAASALGHSVTVISRCEAGAPGYERQPGGVEVHRVGANMRRRMLTGRTFDRILHARTVLAKLAALDAAQPFDVVEAAEANLDAEDLVRDPGYAARTVICCHGGNLQGQVVDGLLAPIHRLDFEWSCRREHEMLRRAQTILVSSEATRAVVLSHGVDPARIHFLPLGIDVHAFRPGPETGHHVPLTVGFVGRLQERKGLDFVWKVMERIGPDRGIVFHFKGAIHPTTRTETLRHLADFESFATYYPPGSNDEMPGFMRTLDVLLVPSRFENFGLTYVEAMASGLIVFAGQAGGGQEVVTDGVTGFLVEPDGPIEPVVDRLLQIQANRAQFGGMIERARARVVESFSLEKFATAKIELYREISRRAVSK
jgi:glycogen(starch) synthase